MQQQDFEEVRSFGLERYDAILLNSQTLQGEPQVVQKS